MDRLNAAQQAVIDLLGRSASDREPLPASLGPELHDELVAALEPWSDLMVAPPPSPGSTGGTPDGLAHDATGGSADDSMAVATDNRHDRGGVAAGDGEVIGAVDNPAAPAAAGTPTAPGERREMWIGKRNLAMIHGCEAHYLADVGNTFRWTPASARGVVSHKAIELLINWRGEPTPAQLVDEAIARLCDSLKGVGSYLEAMTEGERAELRGLTTDRVTKFLDCFPPLAARWRPVTESSAVVELWDGALKLGGKADLTLGAVGQKVIIDLKSGGTAGAHREDLRFYALLETIRMGAPPRKVATYYLDQARAHAEDIREEVLHTALRRTVDGVSRIIELERGGAMPTKRPGAQCRWCPLAETCEEGTAYLTRLADPDAEFDRW